MDAISPEMREQFRTESWVERISMADLIDQLYEAEDVLKPVVDAGDPAMIGEVVLAVKRAYARRMALQELYDEPVSLPSATQAAALAVIQYQARKAGLSKMEAAHATR